MITQAAMTDMKQVISRGEAETNAAACAHPCLNESAFLAFHSRTARQLWRYLYCLSGDRNLTDDLLQETYLKFLGSAAHVSPGAQLVGYLYRIASHLFVDHQRRRKLERRWLPSSCSEEEFHEPVGDSNVAAARHIESSAEVADLIGRLKSQDQVLVWLAYGEGRDHREIARLMSLKEKSIKVLLHRIRAKLTDLVRKRQRER